jgi:hypothetical protein
MLIPLYALLLAISSSAGAVQSAQISARIDREELDLDESVQLQISVHSDAGGGSSPGDPEFEAPDFDIVSQRQAASIDSRYENGRFSVRKRQDFLFVMRPKRAGQLRVHSIRVRQGTQTLTAPDLTARVFAAGAAARPPRGYGGSGVGLRGAGKRALGAEYFLRAETDQNNVYKGEQVILSYFLYSRVNVGQPVVTKYPILNGFLREDLEIPIIQGPLENERVVLDGVPYARTLLARYATYPLQAGKARVDSMAISLLVSDPEAGNPFGQFFDDENDPFGASAMLSQMLKRTLPGSRKATAQSEIISLDVAPLPIEGKSPAYSGLVGEFRISAVVDRTEAQQGTPLTLTLKVEGSGNVAALRDPTVQWPTGVDLYESKGNNKIDRTGISTRTIEYLLIPQVAGELELPAFELQIFNPRKKEYQLIRSDPIRILVHPTSSSAQVARASPSQGGSSNQLESTQPESSVSSQSILSSLKEGTLSFSKKWVRVALSLTGLLLLVITGLAGQLLWKRHQEAKAERDLQAVAQQLRESKGWDALQKVAETPAAELPWSEVLIFYERLSGALYDLIDRKTGITSRSISREVLGEELSNRVSFPAELWLRIAAVLEFAETVRFATNAGFVSEEQARKKMKEWVREGRNIEKALLA